MNELQKNYLEKKSEYLALHDFAEKTEQKILNEKFDRKSKPRGWILTDSEFQEYLKIFYKECETAGIKCNFGEVIDFKAHEQLIKAENQLLDWFLTQAEKYGNINIDLKLKRMAKQRINYKEKVLELALKWIEQ